MGRDGPGGDTATEVIYERWPNSSTGFVLQRLKVDSELLCTTVDGCTRLLAGGRESLQGESFCMRLLMRLMCTIHRRSALDM